MLDEWTFNGHTFALIDARAVRGTWLVLMDTEVLMERIYCRPELWAKLCDFLPACTTRNDGEYVEIRRRCPERSRH